MADITSYLLLIGIGFLMGAFASSCHIYEVEEAKRKWHLIGLAMIFNYVVSPSMAYLIGIVLNLDAIYAFGIFVTSTMPMGALANAFAIFFRGHSSISVFTVGLSNILSLGMIPCNSYTFSVINNSKNVEIDWLLLIISVIIMVVSISFGFGALYFDLKKVINILKVMGAISTVLIFTIGAMTNSAAPVWFCPPLVIAASVIYYIMIWFISFCVLIALRYGKRNAFTITTDLTNQNIAFAITVTVLSIKDPINQAKAINGPIFMGIINNVFSVLVGTFMCYFNIIKKENEMEDIFDIILKYWNMYKVWRDKKHHSTEIQMDQVTDKKGTASDLNSVATPQSNVENESVKTGNEKSVTDANDANKASKMENYATSDNLEDDKSYDIDALGEILDDDEYLGNV